jgi:tetratricopeptide (TPR) repeat protein
MKPLFKIYFAIVVLATCMVVMGASGCALSVGNLAENLSLAIMNQDDPEVVRDGAPAYLLLVDSFIEGDPESVEMLRAGATLYGVYAAVFVEDSTRAKRLADRSREYGERALCARQSFACGLAASPYEEFVGKLQRLENCDVPALYSFAVSWLVWIKVNDDNWTALADLPKVEAALERIIQVDETYERGSAHLYLGVLKTLRPPALGGKPDEGRRHFERAIELSSGRDLSVKVEFARNYARLVYDRELHDRLLREVLEADGKAPGLTLLNTLAKRQARELIMSAEDYF